MTVFCQFLFSGDFTIINEYVGTISVAKTINAERISLYNLTVMAKDEGNLAGGMALNTTVSETLCLS